MSNNWTNSNALQFINYFATFCTNFPWKIFFWKLFLEILENFLLENFQKLFVGKFSENFFWKIFETFFLENFQKFFFRNLFLENFFFQNFQKLLLGTFFRKFEARYISLRSPSNKKDTKKVDTWLFEKPGQNNYCRKTARELRKKMTP